MASSTDPQFEEETFGSHKLGSCCKNLIGMLLNSKDETISEAIKAGLKEFNFNIPKQTLHNWKRLYSERGHAISPCKQTGMKKTIGTRTEVVLVGMVSNAIENHISMTHTEAHKWLCREVGVKCSLATVWRVLRSNGFSSQQGRVKGCGVKELADERASIYMQFLQEEAKDIYANYAKSNIASIDFTYTSYRSHTPLLLGYTGGYVDVI